MTLNLTDHEKLVLESILKHASSTFLRTEASTIKSIQAKLRGGSAMDFDSTTRPPVESEPRKFGMSSEYIPPGPINM